MIPDFFIDLLKGMIDGINTSLPPWDLTLGGSCVQSGCTGADSSYIMSTFEILAGFDRFFPVHDCLLPLVTIGALVTAGFLIIKIVKFVISCIPSISAGG